MQLGCQGTSVHQAQEGDMLVADAAGPHHSCGSKAPMGPRMSRNSSLTHSQGQSMGAALHDEKALEIAEPVPCPSSGSGFLTWASCDFIPNPGSRSVSDADGCVVLATESTCLVLIGNRNP